MDLKTFCKELPKIELHAHLNGSVSTETLKKLAELDKKQNHKLAHDIDVPVTLKDCFQLFNIVHAMTDTPESVFIAACDVIEDFCNDNVIYLELRSTPRHVEGKMTKEEYIEAVIKAIDESKKRCPKIQVKLLISVNRKQGLENAAENIKLAIEYYKKNSDCILGIDLSGDPTEGDICLDLLQSAREIGLKIAAHCGEVPNEQEVLDILKFKPDRLGHCTCIHPNLKGSQRLYKQLLSSKIPIELCLTSNIKCGTVPSYIEHHFSYLYADKHPICIGTDDKGVFATTLSQEFELIGRHFDLTNEELKNLALSAVQYSFTSDSDKTVLSKKIQSFII